MRPADLEPARRVDQITRTDQHLLRQHRLDDLLDHRLGEFLLLVIHAGMMLGREHDGLDHLRTAAGVADGQLRFGVGPQPRQAAVATHLALALHQPVRVIDWKRHERRRLVAGIAEHQALIAGALVHVLLGGAVDAARDVRGLPAVADHDRATLDVETELGVGIADAMDGVARDARVIMLVVGGDLAGQHHQAGRNQCFGGYAAMRVLR